MKEGIHIEFILGVLAIVVIFFIMCIVAGIRGYCKYPKPPKGMTYDELREYYYTRAWEKKKSVREYVEEGEKLQAIKELRAQTGCSLADAKVAVEQLEISIKRRNASVSPSKESSCVILYTISDDAQEWREWSILLSQREERIYRRAIKNKIYLEDVLSLSTVLDRAEFEIMEHENLDYPPRVIIKDPNYPAEEPNIKREFIHEEHFQEVKRLLHEHEDCEKELQRGEK